MNSPKKTEHQILGILPVNEAKDFLLECVNLPNPIDYPDHRPHFDRWLRRWQRVFTFESEGKPAQISRERLEQFAPSVRTTLRRIWAEPDTRQRDWYFYRLRDAYHGMIVRAENPDILDVTDGRAMKQFERISRARGDDAQQKSRFLQEWTGADLLEDVPKVCPFEAALYWLQNNQRLMLHCGGPICAAPYFFRTEKGQKFCSPECADPARREAKLRWWNESPNSPKNQAKKKTTKRKPL
jgi:hypothetical protein